MKRRKGMKKKILSLLLVLCLSLGTLVGLTACNEEDKDDCTHSWSEASCDAGKKCTKCGATEGSPLGHSYAGGTCIFCAKADPSVPPKHTHSYTEEITKAADCTTAGEKTLTCSCGDIQTLTIRAGHNYVGGTCTVCSTTATKEQIIAESFASGSVTELLEEIKIQYNETPELDLDALLRYFDLYVNVPTYKTEVSVKGGYVTLKDENGSTYIGFKDGNMIMAAGGQVVGAEQMLPPTVSAPSESIDATFEMLEEYIGGMLDSLPAITAEDLTLEDGWFILSNEYNKELVKAVTAIVYPIFAEGEVTDDMLDGVLAKIDTAFESADIKLGFAMDGDYINGFMLSVSAEGTDEKTGATAVVSAYAELKLSADMQRLETAVANVQMNIAEPDEPDIEAKLEASVVPTYNADGTYTLVSGMQFYGKEGDLTVFDFRVNKNSEYNENGMATKTELSVLMLEGNVTILDLGAELEYGYNDAGAPISISANVNASMDEFTVNSMSVYVPDGQGGGNYAEVEAVAEFNLELVFEASFGDVANGNAVLDFDVKATASNPKLVAEDLLNEKNEVIVSSEVILGCVSSYEREELLDVSGSNIDAELGFSMTGGDGKLTFTLKDEDGFSQSLEVDVAVNSDKSKLPPRDIISLIQNYDGEGESGGNNPDGGNEAIEGCSATYNSAVSVLEGVIDRQGGEIMHYSEEDFADMPLDGVVVKGSCVVYTADLSYMAQIYQCADAYSYGIMLEASRESMDSDPEVDGYTLTELGEYVFVLEIGAQKFGK